MNWKHCYVQAGFIKRQWNQRENCQHLLDHRESIGIPEKHLLHFIDYVKAFDCVDHNKLWKILKEVGIPDYFTCLLRIYIQVKKQQLEPDVEQPTGSKSGKEYAKAIYCHPAF